MTAAQIRILVALAALVGAVGIATGVVFYLGDREQIAAPRAAATTTAIATMMSSTTPPVTVTRAATPTAASATRSVSPVATAVRGLSVRATAAVNVRAGPGTSFAIIGSLQPGEVARVTGRDSEGAWLMIELTAGSGWVSAGVVDVTGDLALAPVTTPGAGGTLSTGTPTPTASATAVRTSTPTPSAVAPSVTPTAPRTTGGLPDIALQEVAAAQGGRVSVSIGNAGAAPVVGRRISVVALDEAANVIFSEVTAPLTLAPGSAVTVELSYQLATTITITVILNADASVEETNQSNNRRRVTLTPR